jgi:hypothetical protein
MSQVVQPEELPLVLTMKNIPDITGLSGSVPQLL